MTKKYKDAIITFYSGNKLRYRKDGRPDMRYTLGKKENAMFYKNEPASKGFPVVWSGSPKDIPAGWEKVTAMKKPIKKRTVKLQKGNILGLIKLGLMFGASIALIMFLQRLSDLPNEQEFLSPLSDAVMAEEKSIKSFCDMDEVSKEICFYNWDARKALAIAMAENGYLDYGYWRKNVQNINSDGTVDTGIMQVNSIHGYLLNELVTVEGNVKRARQLHEERESWDTDGFNAWVQYGSDKYYQALELIKEYENE